MVTYGLNLTNERAIAQRANDKADGVYSFRGVDYRVRDGLVTHYASAGQLLERAGCFNALLGTYKHGFDEGKRRLKLLN